MKALTKQQPDRLLQKSKEFKITGAILAGGRASRLDGLSKGMLLVHGVSIIQHLIEQFQAADVADVVIVANEQDAYESFGVKMVPDIRTGIGPLGGIEAALNHYVGKTDAVLFVPCDMPHFSACQLRMLKYAYIESESPVVFAQTNAFFLHPLCAVVHSALLSTISSAIDQGTRGIRDMWRHVGATAVDFPDERAFFNVNSFDDVRQLQSEEDNNGKESASAGLPIAETR